MAREDVDLEAIVSAQPLVWWQKALALAVLTGIAVLDCLGIIYLLPQGLTALYELITWLSKL